MFNCCNKLSCIASRLESVSLLALRLMLAYGFYEPAMKKLQNPDAFIGYLESMNFPLATLNGYLAIGTEALGVVLLALGLGTRLISLPLMFVMGVAIFVVHWGSGFAAANGGFEIPLYYFLMLFTLFTRGSGCLSLDHRFCGDCCKSGSCEK